MQGGEVWRATDLNNAYVTIDFGSAKEINLIALLFTNASSAATWRVRAAATEADVTASPAYDSGSNTLWPTTGLDDWDTVNAILFLSTSQTYRYWRIDVSDTGNSDGYIEAGRLYMANAWQSTRGQAFGWSIGWEDESPKPQAIGGQTYPVRRTPRRILNMSINFLQETEIYNNAFQIDRLRGQARDILFIVDPDKSARLQDQTVYGLVQEFAPVVNPTFNIFEKRYRVEELLP